MSKFFLALIAYSLLVQAGLVSAVRLRVLTVGADKCTPRKVAAIEAALSEAVQMADAAINALANPQVVNSESFINFLGKGNNAADISKNKFQTVKAAIGGGKLVTLTSLGGASANDVTFICPPDDEELAKIPLENPLAPQSTEKCRGTFFALARDSANLVRVCPIFFDQRSKTLGDGTVRVIDPQTLAAGAKLHLAGDKIGGVPAITIVHEFQHLSKIVGNRVLDLESDVDPIAGPPPPPAPGTKDPKVKNPAYSVDQCKGLSAKNKILNAQNFAWFAFDVFADKNRGLPCGSTPSSPVATGSSKPGGTTPPGSPKPPAKPIVRRAKTTSPKAAAAKVAAPKKVAAPAAPKKAAVATPKKVAAPAAPKKAVVPAAPKKVAPVAAAPGKVAKPAAPGIKAPVAAKPVGSAPKKVAAPAGPKKVAAPKPNPLGGGTVPSGPRLARPSRLASSAAPSSTRAAAGAGAKKGAKTSASATSTGVKKPAPTGKVAPTVCKVNRRAILQPISIEGFFVG